MWDCYIRYCFFSFAYHRHALIRRPPVPEPYIEAWICLPILEVCHTDPALFVIDLLDSAVHPGIRTTTACSLDLLYSIKNKLTGWFDRAQRVHAGRVFEHLVVELLSGAFIFLARQKAYFAFFLRHRRQLKSLLVEPLLADELPLFWDMAT